MVKDILATIYEKALLREAVFAEEAMKAEAKADIHKRFKKAIYEIYEEGL